MGEANVIAILRQREIGSRLRCRETRALALAWAEVHTVVHGTATYLQLPRGTRSTISMAYAADGTYFASTHGDHTVKVTDTATHRVAHTLYGHPRTPWTVKFHPVSPHVIASGCLGFQVRLWDLRRRRDSEVAEHHRSSRGARYPRGADGRVSSDPRCLRTVELCKEIISIAFHPTINGILAIASGRGLYIWHFNNGPTTAHPVCVLKRGHTLRCVNFTPCGNYLVTGETNPALSQMPLNQTRPDLTVKLTLWRVDCGALHSATLAAATSGMADISDASPTLVRETGTLINHAVLYNDGGLDLSPCGQYIAACQYVEVDDGVASQGYAGAAPPGRRGMRAGVDALVARAPGPAARPPVPTGRPSGLPVAGGMSGTHQQVLCVFI